MWKKTKSCSTPTVEPWAASPKTHTPRYRALYLLSIAICLAILYSLIALNPNALAVTLGIGIFFVLAILAVLIVACAFYLIRWILTGVIE